MGAIAGIYFKESTACNKANKLDRMLEVMAHRGESTHKEKLNAKCTWGVRQNNLSDGINGDAAIKSEGVSVIMDGDIFSCDASNDFVKNEKHSAQLVIDLYKTHGIDFADNIDGTYAIGLYDAVLNRLVLVRDRFGAKPIFYAMVKNALIFASEIKAILASELYNKTVDLRAMNSFLSYGYVPNPDTLFESIRQVRPGHLLVFQAGNIMEKQYWKFQYLQDEKPMKDGEYIEEFREVFERAVHKRIKRFPEAGAFLSGGLDTSGVVAMMHKLKGNSFKVFTAGFKEKAYDETEDANILAAHLSLEHYHTMVNLDKNFPKLLERIVWHHDAPFYDTSAVPSYYAAKLAKEKVDTVLTGDFPDQLLGGSGHHLLSLVKQRNDPFFKKIMRNGTLNRIVTTLPMSAGSAGLFDKIKRFIYRETFPFEDQGILIAMPVSPLLKRCLYNPELLAINEKHDPLDIARTIYQEAGNADFIDKMLYLDMHCYAVNGLMVKVDRMTAAHSLNAISPFHDRELVEFIGKVPSNLKIRGKEQKYIMREALRPMLPDHTLNKRKQGFAMPINEWLVRNLSDYVREILFDPLTLNRGYFNKKFMRTMVENYLAGKTDYDSGSEATIICLITLEIWHRLFMDV